MNLPAALVLAVPGLLGSGLVVFTALQEPELLLWRYTPIRIGHLMALWTIAWGIPALALGMSFRRGRSRASANRHALGWAAAVYFTVACGMLFFWYRPTQAKAVILAYEQVQQGMSRQEAYSLFLPFLDDTRWPAEVAEVQLEAEFPEEALAHTVPEQAEALRISGYELYQGTSLGSGVAGADQYWVVFSGDRVIGKYFGPD